MFWTLFTRLRCPEALIMRLVGGARSGITCCNAWGNIFSLECDFVGFLMKKESKLWIAVLALGCAFILVACGFGDTPTPTSEPPGDDQVPTSGAPDIIITPLEDQLPGGEDIIIIKYPDEYLIYKGYLEAIGGRPSAADFGEIEGRVVSIIKDEVCPYDEEVCSIEPYPSDWGIVRVDRIIWYTPYGEQGTEPIMDQHAQGDNEEARYSSGSQGVDVELKEKTPSALMEGQEVTSLFVLTARPVMVRYVPVAVIEPSAPSGNIEAGEEDTIGQSVQPGEIVYKPLPKEGDFFIFTTRVGDFTKEVVQVLNGLEEGSRFRAEIRYDGTLYISEYEIIP